MFIQSKFETLDDLAGNVRCARKDEKMPGVDEVAEDIPDATIRNKPLPSEEVFFGTSKAMEELRMRLERVACTDVPILIRGEAGSGKEMLAKLIHRRYPGEKTPFYKLTPAGHEGWRKSTSFVLPGDRPNSDGRDFHAVPENLTCIGSLFFEEIAELDSVSQRRLVRMLHDDQPLSMDAAHYAPSLYRVICSTRHDIERQIGVGNFREDLFYSINVVSLYMPSLRERSEDIPGLVQYLWYCCREELCHDVPEPSRKLIDAFQEYAWPGNIRELANLTRRYVLLGSEEMIVRELTAKTHKPPPTNLEADRRVSLKSLARHEVREVERKIILNTLRETRWNRKKAARALKISYRTLLYKIKEAGVPPKRDASTQEKKN